MTTCAAQAQRIWLPVRDMRRGRSARRKSSWFPLRKCFDSDASCSTIGDAFGNRTTRVERRSGISCRGAAFPAGTTLHDRDFVNGPSAAAHLRLRLAGSDKVQEVSKEGADKDVDAVRRAAEQRLGVERMRLWLGDDAQWSRTGGGVRVLVAHRSQLSFVRKRFLPLLLEACRSVLGDDATLELDLVAGLPAAGLPAERSPAEKSPALAGSVQRVIQCESPAISAPRARSTQSRSAPWPSLDTFVSGDANRLVHHSVKLAAEQPQRHSPLFFHGPTGTGKTHLLQGLCDAIRRRSGGAALYLSAEQFTTQFVAAIRETGVPSFRRKFRGLAMLALDDVQFLAGKKQTLGEMQSLFGTLESEGRPVALAADRPLSELEFLGPELLGRLRGGLSLRVDPPDFLARRQLAQHWSAEMGLELPSGSAEFVAAHFSEHARAVRGAILRLQAVAQLHGGKLSLEQVEQALADLVRAQRRSVRLCDIERVVCDAYGLDQQSLQATDKCRRLAEPRMLAMFLARKFTRAPLGEIGRYFGQRSHSSVSGAQKKVADWLANGQTLCLAERRDSASETLRRLEAALRVG